jgi:hypothetical protein
MSCLNIIVVFGSEFLKGYVVISLGHAAFRTGISLVFLTTYVSCLACSDLAVAISCRVGSGFTLKLEGINYRTWVQQHFILS